MSILLLGYHDVNRQHYSKNFNNLVCISYQPLRINTPLNLESLTEMPVTLQNIRYLDKFDSLKTSSFFTRITKIDKIKDAKIQKP